MKHQTSMRLPPHPRAMIDEPRTTSHEPDPLDRRNPAPFAPGAALVAAVQALAAGGASATMIVGVDPTAGEGKRLRFAAVALLLLGICALPCPGEVINGVTYLDGVTVNSFSSEANLGEATLRSAANTVSDIGLTASTGEHDSTAIHMWMTRGSIFGGNGPRYPDTLPGAYIVFDLGAPYDLGSIHVWNFCEGLPDPYAVNSVNIAASATTTFGAGTTTTFTQETSARTGFDYAFAATEVRYVKFTIQSNYTGGYNLAGLAKVRFQVAAGTAAWNQDADGNWSEGGNWLGGIAATGTTGVATFTNAITGDRTVTVDSTPWTINGLTFGNTGSYGFTVTGGTLNLAGPTPTITVNASSIGTISSAISNTTSLSKAGSGTLVLNGAFNSTYNGTGLGNGSIGVLNVTAGTLEVGPSGSIATTTTTGGYGILNICNTAGQTAALSVNGGTIAVPRLFMNYNFGTCTPTFTLNSGAVTFGEFVGAFPSSGTTTSTININGGTLTAGSAGGNTAASFILGAQNGGAANVTLNQADGLVSATGADGLQFSSSGGAAVTTTYNLNGGVLLTLAISNPGNATAANQTFTFGGGTLQASAANADFMTAARIGNVKIKNAGAFIDTQTYAISIGNVLSDYAGNSGGLTKLGAGTLTLTGTNTYTGTTTVNAGTLTITHACLDDASTVTLASGARLDLNFDETGGDVSDTVANLIIGTTPMPAGIYGATGSGATTIDDTHFSGVGTLTVTGGGGYGIWAATQGLNGAPGSDLDPAFDADPNQDGIQNGIAWILGAGALGDPAANLLKLPAVTRNETGALVLTFERLVASEASASLVVQYGDDLGATPWTNLAVGTAEGTTTDGNGVSVAVALGAGSTTDHDRITVTIPATYMTAHPKTFARLMATE
ncbi:MAG: autotransporter-associated beta strand repeat-containing protein [Verrucomicrobia bacterium]|nr:autotransporter-associated beta strand repeat-containing protein [Verrucomicrobiota bacterium]